MGPEVTNAPLVATMEELLSYTALIPEKKVLTKILLWIGIQIWVPSTDTRQKAPQMECRAPTFGSNKTFQHWSPSFSSDYGGCQER